MSKTPYEIRLELLKMANEILATPVFQTRASSLVIARTVKVPGI